MSDPNDPNPATGNPGGPTNQLFTAMHNTAIASQTLCDEWNAVAVADYRTKVDNWFLVWLNHPEMAGPVPVPPMGWMVTYVGDATTGPGSGGPYGDTVIQWAAPAMGTTPVCVPIPLPFSNIVRTGVI
jgi:hypothetical protein